MRKPNRKSLPDHILGLELSKPFTSTPEITADLVIKILAHDSTLWLNNQGTGYRPQVARSLALWQIATQQNPDQLITWAETQKPAAITQTIEKVKTILTLKPSRKFIFTSHVR